MTARVLDLDRMTPADLDAIGLTELERITASLDRLRAHRRIDPELRAAILRRVDEAEAAGRLSVDDATTIRTQLDAVTPAAVLAGTWESVVPPDVLFGPTIGAFPRRTTADVPEPVEWIRRDPARLAHVVAEMARFTSDLKRVAVEVLRLADGLGIPEETADTIVTGALSALAKQGARRDHR